MKIAELFGSAEPRFWLIGRTLVFVNHVILFILQGIRFRVVSLNQYPFVWLESKKDTIARSRGIGVEMFLNLQVS